MLGGSPFGIVGHRYEAAHTSGFARKYIIIAVYLEVRQSVIGNYR